MLEIIRDMNSDSVSFLKLPLSGWGRYPVMNSYLQRPEKASAVAALVQRAKQVKQAQKAESGTVLGRGAGRSYGDAALNPHGATILTERLHRLLDFNEQTGVLRCEAGVSFKELLEIFVPRGWFPGVTPGTKFVTMGGAVASDVHGKNHHREGSFANYVRSLKLILASGEPVLCSRQQSADLFWATMGGMGLTGMITEVELALQPIETAYINLHQIKAQNLDEAIALFDQYESEYQYSVAWIDCLAQGSALGRSILMFGNHALLEDLDPAHRDNPLHIARKLRLNVPFNAPAGLLNRYTMSSFNGLYYTRQVSQHVHTLVDYDRFFYPLDFLHDWNRLYGKNGFVQYQCVFPLATSHEALTKILNLCGEKGWGSFLAVLKRFGPQEEGGLSFPMPGYTLTLDMPVKSGLWPFLEELDQWVIAYGGRVYLAKDARLRAETFRTMYPKFPEWLAVKSQVDPDNVFTSALAERLEIHSL
jgi:decaprenylphospho-beta-D-ribofuranose 2-oxidase